MAHPRWLNKYLTIKPEVHKIYDDLDAWLNYCRFNLTKFDPADLYKSPACKEWLEKRRRRQQWQQRNGQPSSGYQGRNPR